MDLAFNGEERAFEKEVRDFIAANLTPEMKRATAQTPSVFSDPDIGMAWQRALHRKGWGAPGWPVQHGGPDWTSAQRWIFETECARAGVPNVNVMGVKMVGPVIIASDARAENLLPAAHFFPARILVPGLFRAGLGLGPGLAEDARGARWRRLCRQRQQDLDHQRPPRRLDVRAGAHQRTRAEAGRHLLLLIDMKSPGITTRPIVSMSAITRSTRSSSTMCVCQSPTASARKRRLDIAKYLLEFERGAGIASAKLRDALKTVSDLAKSEATGRAIDDPDIAVRMSEIEVDIDTLEMTELRVLSALQTGQNPGAVSSLLKLRVSEIRQAVTRLGVDVIGNDGLYVEPVRPLYRLNEAPGIPEEILPVVPEYLNGRAYTIFGGSSEIQREIVAKMVLGL